MVQLLRNKTWYYLANVDSGDTRGRLKVHVDKKLNDNDVQLQTIYILCTQAAL